MNKPYTFLRKSGFMYLFILSLWLLLVIYYNQRFFAFFQFRRSVLELILLICLVIFLDIFWFHSIYHLGIWIFSKIARKKQDYSVLRPDKWPRVAVLYLTKDDFKESAIKTCIEQDYQDFHIFILDDSIEEKSKLEIDNFVKIHPDKLTPIRRPSHEGYKAGNLNYAISLLHEDYPYFAVCDSDTHLTCDFLKMLIPYFQIDQSIGFVQANHRCYYDKDSSFAYDYSFTEDVYWKYYMPNREQYGFTMFHGRGAIIKTECWREVGGFPDSLTEDLVFSCKLREKGYRGLFIPDVICKEQFPQDYTRLRRRYNRWIKGTTDYLARGLLKLLFNKNIHWYEKIDILASGIVLNLSIPFVSYIFLIGLVFPVFYYRYIGFMPLISGIFLNNNIIDFLNLCSRYYCYIWTWDFFLLMVATSLTQIVPILDVLKEEPSTIFRRLSLFISISFGSVINNTAQFIFGLVGVKSPFLVTGSSKIKISRIGRYLFLSELIVGLILCTFAIMVVNIWILCIGTAMISSFFLARFGWNYKFVNLICYLPLILSVITVILLGVFIKIL